jgi:hypothetical protein
MNKTMLLVVLLLLSMTTPLAIMPAYSATIPVVFVDPASIVDETKTPGGSIIVYVKIADVPASPGVAGVQFRLEWNSTILTCTSIELPTGHFMDPVGAEEAEGNLWKIYARKGTGYAEYAVTYYDIPAAKSRGTVPRSGNGTLAKITLNITSIGSTGLSFIESETIIGDENAIPLDRTLQNGLFDNKPAAPPPPPPPPAEGHDVAVVNVEPASPIIYDDWAVNISVIAMNNGSFTESFTVTAYYNDSNTIGAQDVTSLLPGENVTLVFTWNTSETTQTLYTNYSIKAQASIVTNETETTNNLFVDGPVKVVIRGDSNGDQVVNILDIMAIANAFGSTPESPRWSILGDLNGDGRVTVNDLILMARSFGQKWP